MNATRRLLLALFSIALLGTAGACSTDSITGPERPAKASLTDGVHGSGG